MWKILLAPLLGGVIGYITNDIAIKMLFRPRKKVYIGKWHVPFTPGLIPQQKGRIAASIGKVIGTQLLNPEILKATVVSEETLRLLRCKMSETLDRCKTDNRTLEELSGEYLGTEKRDSYLTLLQEKGSEFLFKKLEEAEIGHILVLRFGSLLQGKLPFLFKEKNLQKSIEEKIEKAIEDVIRDNAPEIIYQEIGRAEKNIMDKRICDLYEENQEKLPGLLDQMLNGYKTVMENNVEKILHVINIERIVEDRINAFDAEQLEAMIFGIMKRELNAIVYLGALLGFLMGFINLLY